MIANLPPEDAILAIGAAGFKHIEFGITHEARYLENNPEEDVRLLAIVRAAAQAGVRISQMHGFMFNPCGNELEENLARARRSLLRGAVMGVEWVVFHPGTMPDTASIDQCIEQSRQRNLDVFGELLQTAQALGLGLAIENMPRKSAWRFAADADDLTWLCERLNSKHAGVCWDTSHACISNLDQPAQLRQLGTCLTALHISDSDGQADRHWAPLRSKNDWRGIINALRDINYERPFNLEAPGESMHLPPDLKSAQMRFLAELCRHLLRPEYADCNPATAN
jgi:sugar phosphate isomerase/epimerase